MVMQSKVYSQLSGRENVFESFYEHSKELIDDKYETYID